MNLIPRDPLSDFYHMFNHAFPSIRSPFGTESFSPRVDVMEKDTAFEIVAELPGVDKNDISVTCRHGTLTIEASTVKSAEKTDENKVIQKERYEGKMMRSFSLSEHIDVKDIYAEFQNGILVVVVPKLDTKTSDDSHRIEIN